MLAGALEFPILLGDEMDRDSSAHRELQARLHALLEGDAVPVSGGLMFLAGPDLEGGAA